eukprot:gnl/TRDRNA2_/TRDRNA2_173087_c0_seq1.p1 gnl/TRDRNA2_/TRDRNA2_173087_c0~~gnl/TRDRNA2_/TRDRNA2_173087_c0_seq1.p1  ORF type:complete len:213 (+),score=42.97 gnl/TRDRNA2_/TRDRNA2_173087_c0_seq1:58-696(+)
MMHLEIRDQWALRTYSAKRALGIPIACFVVLLCDASESDSGFSKDEIRCEQCMITVQNIAAAFLSSESKKGRPLNEMQVSATLEEVCPVLRFYGGEGADKSETPQPACERILHDSEESDLYTIFQKHVTAPKKSGKHILHVSEGKKDGVGNFMRELCLAKKKDAAAGGAKPSKKKRSATPLCSCSEDLFYFPTKDWKETLKMRKNFNRKIEL